MKTADILERVAEFALASKQIGFDDCFVFGSVVNRGGQPFIRKGNTQSDIDIVVAFSSEISNAKSRVEACCALLPIIQTLECNLETLLVRETPDKATCVVLPMTAFEIYHNIHEGQDISLLRTRQFCRPHDALAPMFSLSNTHDGRYHTINNELILAMRYCQQVRKEFLNVAPSGAYPKLKDFQGTDPAPKALMRRAALVKSWIDNTNDSPDRTELSIGNDYLIEILRLVPNEGGKKQAELIKTRGFPRGEHGAVSRQDQLLASEVLCDVALSVIPATLREKLDRLIHTLAADDEQIGAVG